MFYVTMCIVAAFQLGFIQLVRLLVSKCAPCR